MSGIVVLGLGNVLMTDDGAGIAALFELDRRYEVPDEVERLDGGVLGLQLLGRVEDAVRLIVLDAVSTGREPGTIVRLGLGDIRAVFAKKLSMHQVGFNEVLAAAAIRGRQPPEMVVLGVEPAAIEGGLGLSAAVAAAVPALVAAAVAQLADWGVEVRERATPLEAGPGAVLLGA